MLVKYLEKKVELESFDCTAAEEPIELEYYLLESEIRGEEELDGRKVYGIEVVKRVNDVKVERKIIKDVSCFKESTLEILKRLAENSVTPVSLPFILEDMIGNWREPDN